MKIIFRVDASLEIGTGHVMRCLTLAFELKKRSHQIEFICRAHEGNLCGFIEAKGFKTHILPPAESKNDNYCFHAHWLNCHWQEDAAQTLLIANNADWLIVDHYAIDEKWESMLHPNVNKLMVIDDLADRNHICDVLLDQNYYTDAQSRYKDLVEPQCQLLLSPKFALLREEFLFAKAGLKRNFNMVHKILVFFGGVDANNDTGKAIAAIADFKGEVFVVAGAANINLKSLEEFCAKHLNFKLLKSVSNMAELMANVDLSIGGGGSTSWERAVLGLPALAWPIAENQVRILHDLSQTGAVKITSPEKLAADLKNLTSETLRIMSFKAAGICDGEGTVRVANKLGSM